MTSTSTKAFTPGCRLKAKNPNKVFKEIEKCKAKDGTVDLNRMITRARRKNAVLHKEYEWDDARAAHEHRLETSRKIVRSIIVVEEGKPEHKAFSCIVETRSTVGGAVTQPKKVYRSTEEILRDPTARMELLRQAWNDASAFSRKYRGLKELAGIMAAMDDAFSSIAA